MSQDMSRAMKIVAFASAVLGLLAGLASGVPEGQALALRLFSGRTLAMEQQLSAFSAAQFRYADSEHARQAVLSEIRTLELLDRRSLLPSQNPALYLAYARLAVIEEAAGRAPAARAALAKARAQWSMLHPGSEVAAGQIEQAVRDFDNAGGRAGR